MSNGTILILANNIRRVFKKMGRELEPGNDDHNTLLDLVNHGDTLAQQIESECEALNRSDDLHDAATRR